MGHGHEPGARGRAGRAPARASNSSSVARPQAMPRLADEASWSAAAIPQGPSSVLDSHAARWCSRAARSASRAGPKPPAAGQLHVHGVARAQRRGGVHVLGAGDRLVGGHGDLHPGAHLGQLLERGAGLLDQLQVQRRQLGQRRHGLVGRPGAVGVHPDRGPRAHGLAHGAHPLGVVGQPDLDLEARVALAQARLGGGGHLVGGARRGASGSPGSGRAAARPAAGPAGAVCRSSSASSQPARAWRGASRGGGPSRRASITSSTLTPS